MASAAAIAQTTGDALRFSENDYFGTAKSVAMGNAFTALGGDLGSVTINPAGSAVNGYSQITITPGFTLSATSSKYNEDPLHSDYGNSIDKTRTRFTMPNFGLMGSFKTGNRSGLKAFSIGFVCNSSNYYIDNMRGAGRTDKTSYAGEMADFATRQGLYAQDLDGLSYDSASYPYTWDVLSGYNSGIITTIGNILDADGREIPASFIGTTEKSYDNGDFGVAGMLDQRYGRRSTGCKYDMAVNFGLNFSDRFYVGANIGLISIDSDFASFYKEGAEDSPAFDIDFEDGTTRFRDFRVRQAQEIRGIGVYGKFGLIFLPTSNIRLGVAIQTPTTTRIKEHYRVSSDTHYADSRYDGQSTSPEGNYEYRLISPFRVNAGVAFTFRNGLISADYEMCDYSGMKYKSIEYSDNEDFYDINQSIKDCYGIAHMVRVGAEYKLAPDFAVRAGYNFGTSPERYYNDMNEKVAPKSYTHGISFGVGYSSPGSFFMDAAVRGRFKPATYTYPYGNYIDGTDSPEIKTRASLWDGLITIGWRF